ncbi:MAG TPA: hypothetical protein VGV61_19820, partial [Thermoanaerobaculia bacterium]|nr:hypothetical protein [Thermoanaerobaculia bacterium]
LNGMTASQVLAESERIDIRRERALEEESVAAYQEVLAADERLAHLRVTSFQALSQDEARMEAAVTVRNELKLPVETAWLRVEVGRPGGPSRSGDEFVAFRPPLRPGEQRTVRIKVVGTEAAELPVEPPAQARYQFQLVESGGRVALQAPTPEERRKAEAAIAASRQRVKELDARLAAVREPK